MSTTAVEAPIEVNRRMSVELHADTAGPDIGEAFVGAVLEREDGASWLLDVRYVHGSDDTAEHIRCPAELLDDMIAVLQDVREQRVTLERLKTEWDS